MAKNFNSLNKNSYERGRTSIYQTKLQQAVKNLDPSNKAQTNGEERQTTNQNFERTVKKRRYTQWKLKRTVENAENGCSSTPGIQSPA